MKFTPENSALFWALTPMYPYSTLQGLLCFPTFYPPKFAPYHMQSFAASPEETKLRWCTCFEMSSEKVSLDTESIPDRRYFLKLLHLHLALVCILSDDIHILRKGGNAFLFESYNWIDWDLANSLIRKMWTNCGKFHSGRTNTHRRMICPALGDVGNMHLQWG